MQLSVSALDFSAIAQQDLLDPAQSLARFLYALHLRLSVSLDARFTISLYLLLVLCFTIRFRLPFRFWLRVMS
jgi:hypothetical protein